MNADVETFKKYLLSYNIDFNNWHFIFYLSTFYTDP